MNERMNEEWRWNDHVSEVFLVFSIYLQSLLQPKTKYISNTYMLTDETIRNLYKNFQPLSSNNRVQSILKCSLFIYIRGAQAL
jgi:hypothetical protein